MHDAFLQRQAQNKTLPAGLYGQARPFMNEAFSKQACQPAKDSIYDQ